MTTLSDSVRRHSAAMLGASVLALAGIAGFEGAPRNANGHAVSYMDAVNVPTICYGHTRGVVIGQKATMPQCELWLKEDVGIAGKAVARLVKVPLTQGQYDALGDFTYNCGEGNLAKSTLLTKINRGDCYGAAEEFPRWNKAQGKVLAGLTKRRAWERSMWLEGCSAW